MGKKHLILVLKKGIKNERSLASGEVMGVISQR